MMKHFAKLQAPLYSINEYPTLEQQEKRFRDAGWHYAEAKSLWNLWSDPEFLTPSQRQALDQVEPFDEWEEFALFASHYFLLSASTRKKSGNIKFAYQENGISYLPSGFQAPSLKLSHHSPTRPNTERRFGAIIPISHGTLGVNGGFGREARLASTDIYFQPNSKPSNRDLTPPVDIGPRMCHSSTLLNEHDCFIAGGRTSPRVATSDCWLRRAGSWQLVNSLPAARFRHCAAAVSVVEEDESVLIFGGKTDTGEVLGQWLLWSRLTGWKEVQVLGEAPSPRFGASMPSLDGSSGILFGGMTCDGVILEDFWSWSITRIENDTVSINLIEHTERMKASNNPYKWLARFGASTNLTSWGLIIMGGVSLYGCIPDEYETMLLDSNTLLGRLEHHRSLDHPILAVVKKEIDPESPRPLLTGHASWAACPGEVLIVGGGGVCFSFGTYRNQGTWVLQDASCSRENEWRLLEEKSADKKSAQTSRTTASTPRTTGEVITTVPRITLSSPEDFKEVLGASKPVILTGLDIGPCRELWTNEYLEHAVGRDRKVVVHEAGSDPMNFQSKNFSYVTKDFGTFLSEVTAGNRQYLRSISSDKPARTPANLASDFPGLRDDFRLPPELSVASEQAHSSPLRISGMVNMWLHYDVYPFSSSLSIYKIYRSSPLSLRFSQTSCVRFAAANF